MAGSERTACYSETVDKFEFIAVLLSIVFGLALTNLLSGALRAFLTRDLDLTRIAWTLSVGIILLVNWWGFFRWSDHLNWQFWEFLYLVFWATSHYLLAVSLFPYDFLDEYSEELQRRFMLWAMLAMVFADVGESMLRGALFDPWYFPMFYSWLVVCCVVPLVWRRSWVMLSVGWVVFATVLSWSLVVRGILSA